MKLEYNGKKLIKNHNNCNRNYSVIELINKIIVFSLNEGQYCCLCDHWEMAPIISELLDSMHTQSVNPYKKNSLMFAENIVLLT